MSFLEISNLRKAFNANSGVQHFDLAATRGEFVSFLGPSGCGKTTTLRMVAGFETPTSGSIRIDGRDVTHLRPNQRNVGMVFQSYALFPNMTVAQNVAFGLKVAKRPAAEIAQRVDEMLKIVKLPHLADRYPYQLSGGQQQRVALARALAMKPQILLLDEPLSALDAKIRVSLREEIRSLQRSLGITTIYVTHDQEEALSMSDRIVIMNEGRIEQIGTPFEIYNFPRTHFVASFVGTLNMMKGEVVDPQNGKLVVDGQEVFTTQGLDGAVAGDTRTVVLRPEAVTLNGAHSEGNTLSGTIEEVAFLGSVVRIRVRLRDNVISLDSFNSSAVAPPERGAAATVSFAPRDLQVLPHDRAA
ncbi:ABC transporter ATP-binding protein [Segnochrobactrum spirostomi]|uniref:Spermidine/putrescine import ATP-binding protein PotA n=1 Tax=Segnochrobactrum spirostomi TaxID=2608987 RepID=A0A6A7XZI5_9HYPH|nr:ABC transporter ATP-binding protein [Segnochrobactrum spirostomi]MQT11169.1 ABC transporter ATP-binding protein [Segnochrobactrum spirostomi]